MFSGINTYAIAMFGQKILSIYDFECERACMFMHKTIKVWRQNSDLNGPILWTNAPWF